MRSRALTQTVARPDVSVLVEEFRCQSHALTNTIGACSSHRLWRVRAIGHGVEDAESADAAAIDIAIGAAEPIRPDLRSVTMEVITDAGVGGLKGAVVGTQVSIKADGSQRFPQRAGKSKLHEDWSRDWRFRSLYPGVGLVRPGVAWVPGTLPASVPCEIGDAAHFIQTRMLGNAKLDTMHEVQVGTQQYPAILTKQWANGCFEVTAFKQDEQGLFQAIQFPSMHKSNILLAATGQNIDPPELGVRLEVPKSNPQNASVHINGWSFADHLGRVSPPATNPSQRIEVDVPKPIRPDVAQRLQRNVLGFAQQEEPVHINASAAAFEHFLSGDVRRGEMTASRLEKDWVLQLGPFAMHRIRLAKKSRMSAVMTLYVDDEVLVECLGSDLGCDPNVFRCKFCFVGERVMDFNVFVETKDGVPLDKKCVITKPYQYRHVVEVAYSHKGIDNLADAAMVVDGASFEQLPLVVEREDADGFSIVRTALEAQFPVQIPRKIIPEDTRGMARQLAQNVVDQAGGWDAIGQNASKNVSVASNNFSKTMEDVGNSLSKFGLSAWETVFPQHGAEIVSEGIGSEGSVAQAVRVMPTRLIGNTKSEV